MFLQVAATISPELVNKVLVLSIGEVSKYGQLYRKAIIEYKNKYFKDRQAVSLTRGELFEDASNEMLLCRSLGSPDT